GLPHVDSAQGPSVRHVGAEVLDFARGPARGRQCRGARDRLCTLLSFARRYRHGEWILLVGHERPILAVRARPRAQAPSRDRQRRGRAIRSPPPRCSRHCRPWPAPPRRPRLPPSPTPPPPHRTPSFLTT